jgi:hypothetical protein
MSYLRLTIGKSTDVELTLADQNRVPFKAPVARQGLLLLLAFER